MDFLINSFISIAENNEDFTEKVKEHYIFSLIQQKVENTEASIIKVVIFADDPILAAFFEASSKKITLNLTPSLKF